MVIYCKLTKTAKVVRLHSEILIRYTNLRMVLGNLHRIKLFLWMVSNPTYPVFATKLIYSGICTLYSLKI